MNRLAITGLFVWVGLAGALTAHTQSVTPIYCFTNVDGMSPYAGLTIGQDGNFYGTTASGGSASYGTVFKVTTNGALTTLVNFNGTNGAFSYRGLTLGPDGNFYGTTEYVGIAGYPGYVGGYGTVFQVTTNGALTTLVNFNGTNGANPHAGPALGPDGNFYGTTYHGGIYGGINGFGTVFRMTANGTLTTLVNFNGTNGLNPEGGLTLGPDGNFYGTTDNGGTNYLGNIFRMTTNGMLTSLASFDGTNGANPYASLTLGPDGNFYGTTFRGGSYNAGTVFQMTTNGTLTTLVNFDGTNGANVYAALTFGPDGNFYGTTGYTGDNFPGTVFRATTSGTLTTLVHFNGTNGSNPEGGLTLGPDGNFYGTASQGGNGGSGVIFRLNLPPDFITAPTDQSVVIGGTVTFNCQLFGTAPFAYQWLSNGVPIIGATDSSLTIANVSLQTSNVLFQVVITNAWGSITSSVASVNVLLQPNIYGIANSDDNTRIVFWGSYPNSTNRLWATTNLALPLAQWQVIATNITDSNGLSQFPDTNTAGIPRKFYRLSYP